MGTFVTLLTLAIVTVALPPKAIGMKELAFLTRTGCVNTPKMAHNLNDALKSLGERQGHFRDAGAEAAFR